MRKRCIYCKKLFFPNPRQKGKQKTCGGKECKKKRRCDYSRTWRKENQDYDTGEYRKARRRNRREWSRHYWATHPGYRKWHADYVKVRRRMKKLRKRSVRIPNPDIELNFCKQSTYLKITSVTIPYPDIEPILSI